MSVEKPQVHRPGALKQTNKVHKHGRHRSKSSISIANKGKVSAKIVSKVKKRELNKIERRHQALQIRRNKRDDILSKKRSLGGYSSSPFLVCVLPLNKLIDCNGVLNILSKCDEEAIIKKSATGVTHISVPRFEQRYAFVVPDIDNEMAILDTLKIADTVLFIVSGAAGYEFGDQTIDDWGNNILLLSFSQGLPSPVVALTDMESVPVKKRSDQKRNIQKLIEKWLPDDKLVVLEKKADGLNLLRKIGNQKRKQVVYRDRRPHLYAEDVEFADGSLKVTGHLRGATLSVNDLIHIPGLGDFQMTRIDSPDDPYSVHTPESANTTIRVLELADDSKQESLESENVPDMMDAEQTWPTEEELQAAKQEQKVSKMKKVPKGWSEYQAAWIPDDDAESVLYTDSEADDNIDAMSEEKSHCSEECNEEFETMTESEIGLTDQQYDQQMDFNDERNELEKIKAAKTDSMFPDEVDTPQEVPARERFQKYRGLESFRTSPWDIKENLPNDYVRIFQFANFNHTRKRILKSQEDKNGVMPGWYITVHINVNVELWSNFKSSNAPIVLIGLFPHEHKMSIMNTVLKRTSNYDLPIQSKERLIFQCGYRRFIVNPIFSQHTNGNKHKYERFFQTAATSVATFYAPIQFPPAPVLCFKEVNGKLVLVAHGNLLSCSPDRLVIKRVVLSGHPFKVNKRSAVVRFMFFNREDIVYFKPIKLRTKYGRIGHIKEPLGTHGHMKCIFDGQLKSMDTVFLNLYKRVFPNWTYEECIVSCENLNKMDS